MKQSETHPISPGWTTSSIKNQTFAKKRHENRHDFGGFLIFGTF